MSGRVCPHHAVGGASAAGGVCVGVAVDEAVLVLADDSVCAVDDAKSGQRGVFAGVDRHDLKDVSQDAHD